MIYKGRLIGIEKGKINGEDLAKLANNLLKKDCVNFDIDNVGKGFTSSISLELLKYSPEDKNTSILVINDITLELYNILKENGYNNVTLAFGNWNKEKQNYIDDSKDTFDIMKEYIENNFEDEIKIIKSQEIFSMKFDVIISNPPYAIGNELTKAIVDNVDFDMFVNLMPVSKYKAKELYKQVSAIESVEDTFDDAAVGASLTIAVLRKNANVYNNYQELEFMKMDPRYTEFYKLNSKVTHKYPYACSSLFFKGNDSSAISAALKKMKEFYSLINTTFCCTWRTVQNGTHKTQNCFDYGWNVSKNVDLYQVIHPFKKRNITAITVDFIDMHTEQEKNNLVRFWYNNQLMNDLLKGLHKSSGTAQIAIPSIDYSKERDYEHLTLDDIMNILREENPDVA